MDGLLGPYERNEDTGLKLTPDDLTDGQQIALARATCAAVEHELSVGRDVTAGGSDFLMGAEVTLLSRPSRTPDRVLLELASTGLVTYSGTVATT